MEKQPIEIKTHRAFLCGVCKNITFDNNLMDYQVVCPYCQIERLKKHNEIIKDIDNEKKFNNVFYRLKKLEKKFNSP